MAGGIFLASQRLLVLSNISSLSTVKSSNSISLMGYTCPHPWRMASCVFPSTSNVRAEHHSCEENTSPAPRSLIEQTSSSAWGEKTLYSLTFVLPATTVFTTMRFGSLGTLFSSIVSHMVSSSRFGGGSIIAYALAKSMYRGSCSAVGE